MGVGGGGSVGEKGGGDEMEQRVNRVMTRGKKEKDGVQEGNSGGQVCWICGWIVWQANRKVPFP